MNWAVSQKQRIRRDQTLHHSKQERTRRARISKAGTLKIRRTIHEKRGGTLTPWATKTDAGARTITLSPSTAKLLRERKKSVLTEPSIYSFI